MKRFLALVAAASMLLPTISMAQTPPKGNNNPPRPHTTTNKTTNKTTTRTTNKTVIKNKATTTNRRAGPPGNRGPARSAYRPLPPRGNQFFHRGRYFGRVRGPAYVYPRHWHYRRWGIGAILPALLFSSAYYYADYTGLGLQAPAPGYQWVRFGPDLLLVNTVTGQVEDVVYGVFL